MGTEAMYIITAGIYTVSFSERNGIRSGIDDGYGALLSIGFLELMWSCK